jgi:hypothetical protein
MDGNLFEIFKRSLVMLTEPHSLNIVWNDLYDVSIIPTQLMTQRPLLMDPSNPYVNIAKTCEIPWAEVVHFAKQALNIIDTCFQNIQGQVMVFVTYNNQYSLD